MISKTESETKSGISSIISGLDTPNIDIRKPMAMKNMPETKQNLYDNSGKPLYQILEQSQVIIINYFYVYKIHSCRGLLAQMQYLALHMGT